MRWVKTKRIFTQEPHLKQFVDMSYRGEDFDKITESRLKEGGLPAGPAMRLFNAMQELIRSKDERGHIIFLVSCRSLSFVIHVFVCCCLQGDRTALSAPDSKPTAGFRTLFEA